MRLSTPELLLASLQKQKIIVMPGKSRPIVYCRNDPAQKARAFDLLVRTKKIKATYYRESK